MNTYPGGTRKTALFFFALLVALTHGAHAQALVGNIHVDPGAEFTGEFAGLFGLRVDISDIVISGYSERLLTFALSVSDAEGKAVYTDHRNFETSEDVSKWSLMSFEILSRDLQGVFGYGTHDLYVVLVIHTILNEEMHILPGGYHAYPVKLELNQQDLVSRDQADRQANQIVLSAKAVTAPVYSEILDLTEKYNIGIYVRKFASGTGTTREAYQWDYLTDTDDLLLQRYLRIVVESFVRLPVGFVEQTGLKSIALVKNLYCAGLDVGAGFDVTDRMIIVEVNDFFKEEHVLNALYHEYMHMMDSLFYSNGYFDNRLWNDLNPPDARYSQKGALDMIRENASFVSKEHPVPGFLNGYCLADIYQDKAEVFSYLFVPAYYRKAEGWMGTDRSLAAKFDFMRAALKKISPEFTEDFFDDLHRR